jgi:hypothetical protein
MNGFVDQLYTRLVSTSNYSATANLNNSEITTAPAEPFPACFVFTSRSLATAPNSGNSSFSRAQVLSSQTHVRNSLIPASTDTNATTQELCFLCGLCQNVISKGQGSCILYFCRYLCVLNGRPGTFCRPSEETSYVPGLATRCTIRKV